MSLDLSLFSFTSSNFVKFDSEDGKDIGNNTGKGAKY
jgi:hypothetical protein